MTTRYTAVNFIGQLSLTLIIIMIHTSGLPQGSADRNPPPFDKQGHRGSRGLMPENTIPAMIKAMDLGVNTLEMDVCFTADGKAVLSHEPFFSHAIALKPNGQPVTQAEARSLNIYKMDYEEVKKYDVGSRPHPGFPKQKKMKVSKPLLSEVIDSCELYAKKKDLPLPYYNIETKTSPFTDDIYHPAPAAFVDMMMEVINSAGIGSRTTVQSFDIRTLRHLREKYPSVEISLLIEKDEALRVEEKLKQLGFTPEVLSPEYTMVSAGLVDFCHSHNMKVIPWTVNDAETIERLKEMGVDGIITDYPDLFKTSL